MSAESEIQRLYPYMYEKVKKRLKSQGLDSKDVFKVTLQKVKEHEDRESDEEDLIDMKRKAINLNSFTVKTAADELRRVLVQNHMKVAQNKIEKNDPLSNSDIVRLPGLQKLTGALGMPQNAVEAKKKAEEEISQVQEEEKKYVGKEVLEKKEFEFVRKYINSKKKNAAKFELENGMVVYYSRVSLFFMGKENKFRQSLVHLINKRWFEQFIMLSIFINSIVLSMQDYGDREFKTQYNQILGYIGDFFTLIYVFEAILKIFAMGFMFSKYSYIRELWNLIDFIIVLSGIGDLLALGINLKSLRVLRAVRPLKSLRAMPSLRRLVTTLLKSLPELGNATIFILFMVGLFSILGLQQFTGVIYYRCRLTEKPINSTYWPKSKEFTRVCSPNDNAGGYYTCPEGLYCGSPVEYGISLADDGVYTDSRIQFAISSFDHFGQALLAVIQTMTVEQWTVIMYNIMDGFSPIFTQFYFCMIVILGHYFMLQLLLAVIMSNLLKIQAIEAYADIKEKKRQVKFDMKLRKLGQVIPLEKKTSQDKIIEEKKEEMEIAMGKQVHVDEEDELSVMNFQVGKQMTLQKMLKTQKTEGLESAPTIKLTDSSPFKEGFLSEALQKELDQQLQDVTPNKNDEEKTPMFKKLKFGGDKLSSRKMPKNDENDELNRSQEKIEEKIKKSLMWNLGRPEEAKSPSPFQKMLMGGGGQKNNLVPLPAAQQQDLSKGFGFAILLKVLGVQKFQNQFQRDLDKIKRTKYVKDLDMRLKIQTKILDNIDRLDRKIDLAVTKMYMMSKKNVYGIENELQLVEQVHKSMNMLMKNRVLFHTRKTPDDLADFFCFIKPQLKRITEFDSLNEKKPELDLHMQVTLKIAFNLRDLTMTQNVREYFFSRFKQKLIQKNIVDDLQIFIEMMITDTLIRIRSKKFFILSFCFKLTESKYFKTFTLFVIIFNAIILAMSKYPIDVQYEKNLENLNLICFGYFTFELVVKMIGQGSLFFTKDFFNIFDAAVIFINGLEIILEYTISTSIGGLSAITSLRIVRLFRLVRLARMWRGFNQLLNGIKSTLKDISNISILLVIFIFTYVLLGMELYAHRIDNNLSHNQSNFDNFLNAFLSVFIVLANDGWAKIYFEHYRQTDPWSSSAYFISLLIIGQFILLNLFISSLIENFEQISVRNDMTDKMQKIEDLTFWQNLQLLICVCKKGHNKRRLTVEEKLEEMTDEELIEQQKLHIAILQQRPSLGFFKLNSKVRQISRRLAMSTFFEWFMLGIIIANSIFLAMDNPLADPSTPYQQTLQSLDYIFTVVFAIEAIIKIIAFGFILCGPMSYLRSLWNALDFLIVILTILSYTVSSTNLSAIKSFRLLKVLRPLRVISKNEGLKLSIGALGLALNGIANIMVITLIFYFIFGIILVNYFQGLFFDCKNDFEDFATPSYVDHKWDCLNSGGNWLNQFLNFDNVLQAMGSLFIMSNTVQWSDIMYRAAKVREMDYTPQREGIYSSVAAVFFVIIMIIGNFFLMNLFIGVIISTYNREKELMRKDFLMTEKQKKWVQQRIMIIQSQPMYKVLLPHKEWRQPFYYISESPFVKNFILVCIITNTVVLASQWYDQNNHMSQVLDGANYVFAGIFTLEFIIKFIGYGNGFFKDRWNIFDLVIAVITVIGIIIGATTSYEIGPQTTIIRSFRIARIFYLFKRNQALRSTFQTFLVSLPAMANIGSLLLLIILIYSILGVYLFADIKLHGALSENAHFQTIQAAFITLVRVLTGEDWPRLLEALSLTEGNIQTSCIKNPNYDDYVKAGYQTVGCGNQFFATLYLFSFTLLVGMIFMKLFMAVILQSFKLITERDTKFMNSQLSEHFRQVWSNFDPNATSFIKCSSLPHFLIELGEPLGWDPTYEHNYIKQREFMAEVDLPKYNSKTEYQFIDVFEHLILIMIVRREVINYAIRKKRFDLLGAENKEAIDKQKFDSQLAQGKSPQEIAKTPISAFEKIKTLKLQKEKTEKARHVADNPIQEEYDEEDDKIDKADDLDESDEDDDKIENYGLGGGLMKDDDEKEEQKSENEVVFERDGDSLLDIEDDEMSFRSVKSTKKQPTQKRKPSIAQMAAPSNNNGKFSQSSKDLINKQMSLQKSPRTSQRRSRNGGNQIVTGFSTKEPQDADLVEMALEEMNIQVRENGFNVLYFQYTSSMSKGGGDSRQY